MNEASNTKTRFRSDDDSSSLEESQDISDDYFMNVVNANYSRYIKKAYGYLKSKSEAEDAVQDGVLSAYKKLDTVRDVEALNSWIRRIIVNKALDILRKNKRMPEFYGNVDDVVTYSCAGLLNQPLWSEILSPEQDIMKKENLQQLRDAIECLEDIYRIPLLLKAYEEFSIKEIAELLEISESNVKVRIHRARTKLKLSLGQYFFPYQNGVKS